MTLRRNMVEADLRRLSVEDACTKLVLEALPFVFETGSKENYWRWKHELGKRLEVDPKNILIIGSSAAGVSLSPNKTLTPFHEESDIDVAVISGHHFDLAWRHLRALGTKRYKLTKRQRQAIDDHVKKYIYWGTIAMDRLLAIFPFAATWQKALDYMATVEPTTGREVNLRLYRDYPSLRTYQELGIRKLKEQLLEPMKDSE